MKWMKNIFANKISVQTKSSQVSSLLSHVSSGKPIWTPRQFDRLSQEGYQKNVIVFRCVNLISRGAASVNWLLYDKDHEIEDHHFLNLIRYPSPMMAGSAFIETIISYLLLSGNAYVEVVRDEQGIPCELYVLRPDRIKVVPDKYGNITAYDYTVSQKTRRIYNDTEQPTILHLKTFHPLNDWYGMSPVEAASCSIDQHNAVASHNLSLLQNGGRPTGALLLKDGAQHLSSEQKEDLRKDLQKLYEGADNAGRLMILEGDFEWHEMGLSPKDLDFIEGKNVSAREIAQAYGVPPMLVGIVGDATFANYKEARMHLWEDVILPLLDYLTSEFSMWLGQNYGVSFSYDVDSISALTPKREATWSKLMAAQFLTINEKRLAVGYAPIDGGDVLCQFSKPTQHNKS